MLIIGVSTNAEIQRAVLVVVSRKQLSIVSQLLLLGEEGSVGVNEVTLTLEGPFSAVSMPNFDVAVEASFLSIFRYPQNSQVFAPF